MSKIFEAESFLYNGNSRFIEEMYQKYSADPSSVDSDWQQFFIQYKADKQASEKMLKGATWAPTETQVIGVMADEIAKPAKANQAQNAVDSLLLAEKMTQAFRARGHLLVNLDPLGLEKASTAEEQKLRLEDFVSVSAQSNKGLDGHYQALRSVYCGQIAYEFEHIQSLEEKEWLYEQVEQLPKLRTMLSRDEKKKILKDLVEAESFESFIHSRFPGAKRFSVEGAEASVVFMLEVIRQAALSDCTESVLGMAHRGRLNMLTKIYGKNYASLFAEFRGILKQNPDFPISGDVKYHAGKSSDSVFDGHKIHLTMLPNPSHLEAVNPVLQGKVRGLQDLIGDSERKKVQGILIHGDAAFAGQGVVAETLTFANIEGYRSGGTMHLVINNQVGFTAGSSKTKGGRYATDIAKSIMMPVIHINGEDVEGVLLIARLAERYRQKFGKDITVDLVCYRKYGHNEGDEPMFTQPLMYSVIKERKNPHQLYFERLAAQGLIAADEYQVMISGFQQMLDGEYNKSAEGGYYEVHHHEGNWAGMRLGDRLDPASSKTGVKLDELKKIAQALHTYPQGFNLNSKIARLMSDKQEMILGNLKLDWAMAEALAFGSLLCEGYRVRLSGEDAGRGTFSHRHSVLTDQKTGELYLPLNNIPGAKAKYEVIDSNLSEYGVMGFEYGYSWSTPDQLVLWEGQFGDFANGAQIILDQFISSAEQKWHRMSGLVLLLPHGFEGQGPEHSSARLERYLQLCAQNNMQVINCTTPANYFHALRRQVHSEYRMPLVVMTPKSMLRTLQSEWSEFDENEKFKPVIPEGSNVNPKDVKRVVLCSGKVYFDLYNLREQLKKSEVVLIRLEQLYPFPEQYLKAALKEYINAKFVWCQEEPENMGGWHFIFHFYMKILKELGFANNLPQYIGRKASASPATGYAKVHEAEQKELVEKAIII